MIRELCHFVWLILLTAGTFSAALLAGLEIGKINDRLGELEDKK